MVANILLLPVWSPKCPDYTVWVFKGALAPLKKSEGTGQIYRGIQLHIPHAGTQLHVVAIRDQEP